MNFNDIERSLTFMQIFMNVVEAMNSCNNNNNNNLSCNKGRAFAEHGIRRYHAITAQDQHQKDQGWVSMRIVQESATDTSEYPDRPV